MKLVKGVITSDEDENVIMSKDTFYEMDNNFNMILKENKQLKETIKEATRVLNSAKNHYGNDGKNWALERAIRILGDKENGQE